MSSTARSRVVAPLLASSRAGARVALQVTLLGGLAGCGALLGLDDFGEAAGEATSTGAGTSTGLGTTSSSTSSTTAAGTGGDPTGTGGNGTTGPGGGDEGGGGNGSSSSSGGGGGGTGGSQAIECAPSSNTNATGNCDLLDPATCPAGSHCAFANDFGTLDCVPDNAGPRGLGEPCSDDAACAGPLACIQGSCSTFCCPGSNEPCSADPGGYCTLNINPPNDATIFASVCRFYEICELLADDCVDPQHNCYMVDFDLGISACFPSPNDLPEGAPCQFLNDCGESSICTLDGCRQLCDIANWVNLEVPTGGCPTGRTCTDVGGWGDPGGEWDGIGLCLP